MSSVDFETHVEEELLFIFDDKRRNSIESDAITTSKNCESNLDLKKHTLLHAVEKLSVTNANQKELS